MMGVAIGMGVGTLPQEQHLRRGRAELLRREAGPGSGLDTPPRPVTHSTLSICSMHLRTTLLVVDFVPAAWTLGSLASGVWAGHVRVLMRCWVWVGLVS